MNILLGVTGSVAATLTPKFVQALTVLGSVQVVATKTSLHFWNRDEVSVPVWTNQDEWLANGYQAGQKILHIDLRTWADICVVAPLSADTLAKFAQGRADNLLTCVMRAWELSKPVVLAPAMNTKMWEHPATSEHLATLKRWHGSGLQVVDPVEKMLACGDQGIGAMAPIESIVDRVRSVSSHPRFV